MKSQRFKGKKTYRAFYLQVRIGKKNTSSYSYNLQRKSLFPKAKLIFFSKDKLNVYFRYQLNQPNCNKCSTLKATFVAELIRWQRGEVKQMVY